MNGCCHRIQKQHIEFSVHARTDSGREAKGFLESYAGIECSGSKFTNFLLYSIKKNPAGIAPEIPLGIPLKISLRFATKMPQEIPLGIPLVIPLKNPLEIPSENPVEIPPAIPQKTSLENLAWIASKVAA